MSSLHHLPISQALRPWKFPYLGILLSLPLRVSSPLSTTFSPLESSVCASGPLSFYFILRTHSGILFQSIHLSS